MSTNKSKESEVLYFYSKTKYSNGFRLFVNVFEDTFFSKEFTEQKRWLDELSFWGGPHRDRVKMVDGSTEFSWDFPKDHFLLGVEPTLRGKFGWKEERYSFLEGKQDRGLTLTASPCHQPSVDDR